VETDIFVNDLFRTRTGSLIMNEGQPEMAITRKERGNMTLEYKNFKLIIETRVLVTIISIIAAIYGLDVTLP
jgi:hypothetical protein